MHTPLGASESKRFWRRESLNLSKTDDCSHARSTVLHSCRRCVETRCLRLTDSVK